MKSLGGTLSSADVNRCGKVKSLGGNLSSADVKRCGQVKSLGALEVLYVQLMSKSVVR